MKTQLNYIATAFRVEWLKIKGLGLLYTTLLTAALVPLLILGVSIFIEAARTSYKGVTVSKFTNELTGSYGITTFLLILLIILTTSRITQSDHRNNGWLFMETQPLSKFSIYMGKFLTLVVLTTIFLSLFYLLMIISCTIVQLLFPNEHLTLSVEWGFLIHSFLRLWILSLGIIALQLLFSMVFSGFIWPIMLGIFGLGLNVVSMSKQNKPYDFSPYNNLYIGSKIKHLESLNNYFNYTEYLSLFWTILCFFIGYWIYQNKGIKNAIFGSTKRIIGSLAVLLLMIGGYSILTQPTHIERNTKETILAGTIITPQNVKQLTLFENELGTPVAQIPIKDGKFKWETTQKVPFQRYTLKINKKEVYKTYLATGDHINLTIKMNKNAVKCIAKGTRTASATFKRDNMFNYFEYVARNKNRFIDKPERFYEYAVKEWDDIKDAIDSYRTNQNVCLENDVKQYLLQANAVKMLNILYDYQKITSFEDKKFAIPKALQEDLLETIAKPTEYLYANNEYKSWKIKQFLPKKDVENPDSIIMAKLQEMPKSKEKDQLLAYEMVKLLRLTEAKQERTDFFNTNINQFDNKNYKLFVTKQLALINQAQKGSPFPHFEVKDRNGNTLDLVDKFKGKYIVIDWWATWCGPCKRTKPLFEYKAKKYVSDKVVFVSISVDRNEKDWLLETKENKSKVLNYWLFNPSIADKLSINSIPRFMIVSPEGKMYNSNLPRPNDVNFSEIMKEISK